MEAPTLTTEIKTAQLARILRNYYNELQDLTDLYDNEEITLEGLNDVALQIDDNYIRKIEAWLKD